MENNQVPVTPANQPTTQPQPVAVQNGVNVPKANNLPSPIPPAGAGVATQQVAPIDKVCWRSEDGLVVIRRLVKLAQKSPPSDYPCIVIQAFPKEHERIRRIPGGGVELMLTYQEVEEAIIAFNAGAESQGKGTLYQIMQRVPPKPKERKEQWRRRNQARHAAKPSTRPWRPFRRFQHG